MSPLERKKIQAELMAVQSARCQLELRIAEREEEIQRLQEHLKISLAKEEELSAKFEDAKKQ